MTRLPVVARRMAERAAGRPRVVALVPAWNAEAFIEKTLASLAAQTYPCLYLLISDDASTDCTPEMCRAFAGKTPRARLLVQRRRLGWIGNVNALLQAADGDYFFFAPHDDTVEPTYVDCLVDALERHPRAVLAFTDVDAAGRRYTYPDLDNVSDRVERARRVASRQGHWWVPYRGLFRAATARQLGGMRRHIAGEFMADWPWLLELALLGEFVRVPGALVHKVWLKSGLSLSWRHSPWQRLGVMLACISTVRRAGLSWGEELDLHRTMLRYGWWRLRARLLELIGR